MVNRLSLLLLQGIIPFAQAGSINATVGCANTNIAQKDVWVGVPQYTGNDVLTASPPVYCRPDYLGNNQLYMFGESSMLSVSGATGYTWRVFPNPPSTPYFQIVPNTGYLGATIVINSNAPTNQYLVIAEAINACGSGSGFSGFFEIAQRDAFGNCTSGGGGVEQLVFPNPTSDLLTVSLSYNSEQGLSTIESSEVALVDSQGINIYSLKTKEDKLIIPVQHLKEGIYYLKVQTNGNTVQKQVVIKH